MRFLTLLAFLASSSVVLSADYNPVLKSFHEQISGRKIEAGNGDTWSKPREIMERVKGKLDERRAASAPTKPEPQWPYTETVQGQKECLRDEAEFAFISRQALRPWITGWRAKRADALFAVAKPEELSIAGFQIPSGEAKRFGPIELYDLKSASSVQGEAAVKKIVGKYVDSFERIDDFTVAVTQLSSSKEQRFEDGTLREAELKGFYDLRGIDDEAKRRNDRGTVVVAVARQTKGEPWKITSVRLENQQVVRNAEPSFQEITAQSGVSVVPEYTRLEAIRRGGYALAMGDYNNDGNVDMYVGTYGNGMLLTSDGKGRFTEAKDTGIEPQSRVKAAVFADMDNDGKEDLVLIRFVGLAGLEKSAKRVPGEDVVIYRNVGGGKFGRAFDVMKNAKTPFAMPTTVADFNRDGLLDFYVGFPGVKDFTTTVDQSVAANGVKMEGVFFNRGKSGFVMDKAWHHASPMKDDSRVWAHSALAADIDNDNDMDILVVDDRGNLSYVYKNDGKGKFAKANKDAELSNQGYGMGVAASDFNNDGVTDLVYSNVATVAHNRIVDSCKANWGGSAERQQGLRAYLGKGKGKFSEVTEAAGLGWAGEGLGGVEFVDYNNDGLVDMVATNGLWSGTDEEQDLAPFFAISSNGVVDKNDLDEVSYSTVSPVMELLAGFQGDVTSGAIGKGRPQMAGRQRNRLFRNIGNGKFLEVGYVENMDSLADGYVVARSDFNNDGRADLVLRNADPGTPDVHFPPVQVYANVNKETNNVLRLQLVGGSKSNRNAIGTEVRALYGNRWHVEQVLGNSGTVQSERVVHFGLKQFTAAKEVTVRWPSGKVDRFKNLPAGMHKIQERGERIFLGNFTPDSDAQKPVHSAAR